MNWKSVALVMMAALTLGISFNAYDAYLRIKTMIPIAQHEEEMSVLRDQADAKLKKAESRYRTALGEEAHRREMSQLFAKAASRAIDAQTRWKFAQLELDAIDSELSWLMARDGLLRGEEIDLIGGGEKIEALSRGDYEGVKEAERRSAERIATAKKAKQDKLEREQSRLHERSNLWADERKKAASEFFDAMGDLRHAKTELEKLGVAVEWPAELVDMLARAAEGG